MRGRSSPHPYDCKIRFSSCIYVNELLQTLRTSRAASDSHGHAFRLMRFVASAASTPSSQDSLSANRDNFSNKSVRKTHQTHRILPTQIRETHRLQFALQRVGIFTSCLVRVSVACSLLRYGFDKIWKWLPYLMIGLQVTISSSYVVIQFAQGTPISSNWEILPDTKCWEMAPIINYGRALAGELDRLGNSLGRTDIRPGIYIAIDLVLSLMPIRLIRTLNRNTSEKILIWVLMALGLLATATACAKMPTFKSFGTGDPMQGTMKPSSKLVSSPHQHQL